MQEALRQRKLAVAQALALGPRVHSRSRGTFMRTHADTAERAVFLNNRFDKPGLEVVAPPPMASKLKVSDDRCCCCASKGGGVEVVVPPPMASKLKAGGPRAPRIGR